MSHDKTPSGGQCWRYPASASPHAARIRTPGYIDVLPGTAVFSHSTNRVSWALETGVASVYSTYGVSQQRITAYEGLFLFDNVDQQTLFRIDLKSGIEVLRRQEFVGCGPIVTGGARAVAVDTTGRYAVRVLSEDVGGTWHSAISIFDDCSIAASLVDSSKCVPPAQSAQCPRSNVHLLRQIEPNVPEYLALEKKGIEITSAQLVGDSILSIERAKPEVPWALVTRDLLTGRELSRVAIPDSPAFTPFVTNRGVAVWGDDETMRVWLRAPLRPSQVVAIDLGDSAKGGGHQS